MGLMTQLVLPNVITGPVGRAKIATLKRAIERAAHWNGRGKWGMDRYQVAMSRYTGLWKARNRRVRVMLARVGRL